MSDRSRIGLRSARQYQGTSLTGTNMEFLGLHRSGRTNMRIPELLNRIAGSPVWNVGPPR